MDPITTALLSGFLLGIPLLALVGRMRSRTMLRLEQGSAWLFFAPLFVAVLVCAFLRFTVVYAILLLTAVLAGMLLTPEDREHRGREMRDRATVFLILSIFLSEQTITLSAAGRGGEVLRKLGIMMADQRAIPEKYRSRVDPEERALMREMFFPSKKQVPLESDNTTRVTSPAATDNGSDASGSLRNSPLREMTRRQRFMPAPQQADRAHSSASAYSLTDAGNDPLDSVLSNDPVAKIATPADSTPMDPIANIKAVENSSWGNLPATVPAQTDPGSLGKSSSSLPSQVGVDSIKPFGQTSPIR